ncbi:sigma-70 family RNA polymerase sigma factor [Nocardioides sp. R-C-SC26]|uniref:sigma-70 family RNA polymerase sigma factor n=1 Tax=Nocardioides sp. R-C-SC26 TaxID=2870414 RepID=UPI001E383C88|nr:sigma-70 family RNA polymerase sigma factor [Nocardioides sp. R-C-SC26]
MPARPQLARGLDALRAAVAHALTPSCTGPLLALAGSGDLRPTPARPTVGPAHQHGIAWSVADDLTRTVAPSGGSGAGFGDADLATSSENSEGDRVRIIALVELARGGDSEAFGQLYDHYHASVYRFLYYRTRSATIAEDLTSDTFFRALRSMTTFRWQGKDFGAWLMTIARNLATDHFKASRTRLELTTDDMGDHDDATDGPETAVLSSLTNELLLQALTQLPTEQRDCLVMRFLQGMSIAETADVLGRSEGAVKQLQLRGVRNLAKLMPEGIRD